MLLVSLSPDRFVAAEELVSEPVQPSGDPLASRLGRYVKAEAQRFSASDLEFTRSRSNTPFLPVAFVSSAYYGDATVRDIGSVADDPSYQQISSSVAGGDALPAE